MEQKYWEENKKFIESEYRDGTNKLNETIIFDDIVVLYVKSAEASFKIESSEGDRFLRIRRARCFMFIQSFKNFFGKDKENLLRTELEWFDQLPVYSKFLCPYDLEKSWIQRYKLNPLIPVEPFPENGLPMAKFCWALKYSMPGKFLWKGGISTAFISWVKTYEEKKDNLPSCALINCWEMVFYAAIKADLLDAKRVREAYKSKLTDDRVLEFQLTFYPQMVQCFIVNGQVMTPSFKPVKSAADLAKQAEDAVQKAKDDEKESLDLVALSLKPGDIVVVHAFEETNPVTFDDKNGLFYHVAAVVDDGHGGNDLDEIKVTSLWESPPITAIHPIKPILASLVPGSDQPGTGLVKWFWIIRL